MTKEDVLTWYNLQKGSVIIIDEAQSLFPVRDFKKEVPKTYSRII